MLAAMLPSFQRESMHPFWEEAAPLFAEHWHEIAHYHDIPLEPDVIAYERAEANGMLRIYTVRAPGGELMGYAAFLIGPNAHYASSLQAKQDVVFVHPDFRQGMIGFRLVKFADDQLRADGVQVVYHHVKHAHPALGSVLLRRGYEAIETIYAKRLDQE
jgi:GNAT superfamily N-acetyltransferase